MEESNKYPYGSILDTIGNTPLICKTGSHQDTFLPKQNTLILAEVLKIG